VHESVAGGIAVARQAGPVALAETVRTAFADAMDVMLWVCGGTARAAAVLAPRSCDGRCQRRRRPMR